MPLKASEKFWGPSANAQRLSSAALISLAPPTWPSLYHPSCLPRFLSLVQKPPSSRPLSLWGWGREAISALIQAFLQQGKFCPTEIQVPAMREQLLATVLCIYELLMVYNRYSRNASALTTAAPTLAALLRETLVKWDLRSQPSILPGIVHGQYKILLFSGQTKAEPDLSQTSWFVHPAPTSHQCPYFPPCRCCLWPGPG